jgi:C1A family cysteine protease
MSYNEARLHRTHSYNAQLDPRDMVKSIKECLALKLPVFIGVMVYESFQSEQAAKSGLIPYPNIQTEKFIGGHAVCVVAYDDSCNHFTFVNSWSDAWGDNGMGYIPYAYIANNDLCNDCHAFLDVELKLLGEPDSGNSMEVVFNCSQKLRFV